MDMLLAFLGGLSIFLIWTALTQPKHAMPRPQGQEEAVIQYRLPELRGGLLGPLAPTIEGLGTWLQGGSAQGISARYAQLLKQADWTWAPGEPAPPTADAPFWNLETMWAKKLLHAALFALGGAGLGVAVAAVLHLPPVMALAGLTVGLAGFFDADSELIEAAENRRKQIVIEMGYKVPELRVYVRSGRTFVSALRYLSDRPGGPFVKEMHRALHIYDVTADLQRGLRAVIERNRHCEPLVNLCGDLLGVLADNGEVGVVLEAHSEAAQHEQRRQLRQQGQDNSHQMSYVVTATTLFVIFMLVGAPALWTAMMNLGGI
jgi:hypothetical protein